MLRPGKARILQVREWHEHEGNSPHQFHQKNAISFFDTGLIRYLGTMASERLNVIALISGGKDSFYSLLHCIHHGHRVVALANLFPAQDGDDASHSLQVIDPEAAPRLTPQETEVAETDLNSFMYQTVGHEVIPLYAAATGLPLYRLPIHGGAVRHERDYDFSAVVAGSDGDGAQQDETETMSALLRAVMDRHPEANALSAGAILSTYQRTRVESVALRLGLAPLAFLWKYPVLPPPPSPPPVEDGALADDDAQLLRDMAATGLEARIIKVASAGLDEDFLWTRATSAEGVDGIKRALRKFGASKGATLGEGGEFETLVVDGPRQLFRRRIDVASGSRKIIREGGGTSWLMLRGAGLADKEGDGTSDEAVRTPDLLDAKFQTILSDLSNSGPSDEKLGNTHSAVSSSAILGKTPSWSRGSSVLLHWAVTGDETSSGDSIEAETSSLVTKVRDRLAESSLEAHHILNTVIILRRMSDFPKINSVYGKLFTRPNPPSRVTISCGDLLPDGRNISIALTVDPSVQPAKTRQGLHVQSRSYWAPANIGPYSQAVGAPALPEAGTTGLQTWSIAGQIPLIPSTMVLPPPSDSSLQMQIVLSLQHLWRIALDMRIQYWTSAVAFFARSQPGESMRHKTDLAWHAWRLAHKQPDEEDEENDGPDPWDLKYNPEYAALGTTDAQELGGGSLPDWSVLTLRQQNEAELCIPPFFAVEVEELPRGSEVEWHAHLGLSQVDESSVEMVHHVNVGSTGWTAWHTIARTGDTALLHTVLALDLDVAEAQKTDPGLSDINAIRLESVRRLNIAVETQVADSPYLAYANALDTSYRDGEAFRSSTVIPCRSVHSSMGRRWAIICLYRTLVRI